MPDITKRISAAGFWVAVTALIVGGVTLVISARGDATLAQQITLARSRAEAAASEAKTASDGLKQAQVELEADRLRTSQMYAAGLADRISTKNQVTAAHAADLELIRANAREIDDLRSEVARLKAQLAAKGQS